MEHIHFLLSDMRATTEASLFALPAPLPFPVFYSVISYNMMASGFMNNPNNVLLFHFLLPSLKSVPSLVLAQLSLNQDGNYGRKEDNGPKF
jgi:hypothetical protein